MSYLLVLILKLCIRKSLTLSEHQVPIILGTDSNLQLGSFPEAEAVKVEFNVPPEASAVKRSRKESPVTPPSPGKNKHHKDTKGGSDLQEEPGQEKNVSSEPIEDKLKPSEQDIGKDTSAEQEPKEQEKNESEPDREAEAEQKEKPNSAGGKIEEEKNAPQKGSHERNNEEEGNGPPKEKEEKQEKKEPEKGKENSGSEKGKEPEKKEEAGKAPKEEVKPVAPLNEKDFAKAVQEDLDNLDPEASNVPSNVVSANRKENPDKQSKKRRPLDAKVKRWEHKVKLDKRDSDGCGTPVCVLIDSRPKRFSSLCNFTRYLNENSLLTRMFHVQKGDCADAIEKKGHDRTWGKKASDHCKACKDDTVGCGCKVCVASKGKAKTYESVCKAMHDLHDQKDLVTLHYALGDCKQLLDTKACLKTEWFDIDEPCRDGDTESASQNLALAIAYSLTGRFRMCPRIRQVGDPEFQTIEGGDIPQDQVVHKDLKNHQLVCKNKDQVKKPKPPHFWFDLKIKCRDYKIRHCCQCLFGCNPPKDHKEEDEKEGHGHHGAIKVDLPPVKHLFEECNWQPFVSNEAPTKETWDGEDRATALKYGTKKHVCGGKIFDAMYIDARTRKGDVPWDETGDFITKNTPYYGFLCINKNNKIFGRSCHDYKVRYCCLKKKPSQWGEWSKWSKCSKSCGGGERWRDRKCNEKKGEKETCFGNWIDKDDKGKDKHWHLKKQVAKCNEISCPDDSNFTEWMAWETCPVTCGVSKHRRRRGCTPPRHGGKECPTDRNKYEEWKECRCPPCPDPQWTKWSPWEKCSLTCGLGKKRRHRKCEDAVTKQPLVPNMDCLGGGVQSTEDCKIKDCPIDGKWTEWLNWSTCSVLCGKHGSRKRRRYCANPLPQFGGKKCEGKDEEKGKCLDLKPCPVHCEWSLWGQWTSCSVTCGFPGEGTQMRGRHKAQEAKFGGKKCCGKKTENKVCLHEKMTSFKKGQKAIYYCPVDCEWGQWEAWSSCPDCLGHLSGYSEHDLKEYEQFRSRRVKKRQRYRGKKCGRSSIEHDKQTGKCTPKDVPACPKAEGGSYLSQWTEWGPCQAHCGIRGTRKRTRQCIGNDCKGKLEDTEACSGFCPPIGWSQWDEWTNCPVTCGKAKRVRSRSCRDDKKDEMKGKSTCRGIGRQTQRCDMGKCGSHQPHETEGGKDPLEEYKKKVGDEEKKKEGEGPGDKEPEKKVSEENNVEGSDAGKKPAGSKEEPKGNEDREEGANTKGSREENVGPSKEGKEPEGSQEGAKDQQKTSQEQSGAGNIGEPKEEPKGSEESPENPSEEAPRSGEKQGGKEGKEGEKGKESIKEELPSSGSQETTNPEELEEKDEGKSFGDEPFSEKQSKEGEMDKPGSEGGKPGSNGGKPGSEGGKPGNVGGKPGNEGGKHGSKSGKPENEQDKPENEGGQHEAGQAQKWSQEAGSNEGQPSKDGRREGKDREKPEMKREENIGGSLEKEGEPDNEGQEPGKRGISGESQKDVGQGEGKPEDSQKPEMQQDEIKKEGGGSKENEGHGKRGDQEKDKEQQDELNWGIAD